MEKNASICARFLACKGKLWLLTWMGMAIGLWRCEREPVARELQTLDFVVTPFDSIDIQDVFDIILVQDQTWQVEVLAERRMMESLDIHMEGRKLILDRKRKGDYRHPKSHHPQVHVHFDTLARINVFEACSIRSHHVIREGGLGIVDYSKMMECTLEIDMGTFYYWNSPNGSRLTLSGKSKEVKLWNFGLSSINAADVESRYVLASNESQGDCRVRAVDLLEYSLKNTGDIIYYGDPAAIMRVETNGNGRLIRGE